MHFIDFGFELNLVYYSKVLLQRRAFL